LLLLAADWARARGRALRAFVVDHALQTGSAGTAARAAAFAPVAEIRILRSRKPGMSRENSGPMLAKLNIQSLDFSQLWQQLLNLPGRFSNGVIVADEDASTPALRGLP